MGLRCWNGAVCTRDCIKPCRPPLNLMESFASCESKRWPGPEAPKQPAFDWRGLFKLYMAHVLHEEGVTHVRWLLINGHLTAVERAAILEVETELKRENPNDFA